MSERRRVLFGTGYAFSSTIVALLTAIVLRPVMVRFLGIADYGALILATSIVGIAALAADFGFGAALTKFVAEERGLKSRQELVTVAILASLLAGVAPSIVVVAVANSLQTAFQIDSLGPLLLVLAFQVPFQFASITCLSALNGLRQMRAYAFGSAFASLLALGFVTSALAVGTGLLGAAAAMVASSIVTFGVLLVALHRFVSLGGLGAFKKSLLKLSWFGIQISLTNAASTFLYQIDTALVGFYTKSNVAVGYYNIATILARFLWLLPGSISIVAYPALSEYLKDGHQERTRAFIDRALRFSTGIVGFAALGLAFFGRDVLSLLFGIASLPAYEPLIVLVLGAAILGITKSVSIGITAIGRPDLALKIALVGLALTIPLNVILIPRFGVVGAAAATTTAFSVSGCLMLLYVKRFLTVGVAWTWFLEVAGWVGLLAFPALAINLQISGATILRATVGFLSMSIFAVLLYARLIPREDSAFLLDSIRVLLRRPSSR